mmetsp:Transcript_36148/g.114947  ORF Transcript_36148/g.114947 Transcript_36148/m.114947 type:complete len:248 (+) Transcript_36148:139-882(+)
MGSRPSNLGRASPAGAAATAPAAAAGTTAAAAAAAVDVEARRTGGQWAVRRSQAYAAAGLPDQVEAPPLVRRAPGLAGTPSTRTPASGSRGLSSFASPEVADSGNGSQAASSDGFDSASGQQGVNTDHRLSQARQRANESFEALRMELKGFGGAVAVRYASWPVGAAVEVMCPVGAADGASDPDFGPTQGGSVTAKLVRYDAASNAFEVRLRDGSTRLVPAQRVRRVSNTARQPPRHPRPPTPELLS